MTDIAILYTHADFYIVNKPAGVTMHDARHGIVSLLRQQTGEHLHLCHRLDDGTSGALILARHPQAAAWFQEAFAGHQIQKYYLALAPGKPAKKQGTISGDMKNRRRGQHILLKTRDNPAVTQFFSESLVPGIRVYLVKPLTGKTHQIRVALKSLGAPILGDTLYGATDSDRLYLHAYRLCFTYAGQMINVKADINHGEQFTTSSFDTWLASSSSDPASRRWPDYTPPVR